ncbi:MAG: nucleotide pyrophosphohydrolase, partial [Fimbriiglobus sp.]
MPDATAPVAVLKDAIRAFATARGWEPYHSPKNLVMALASEVGELCDVFRWLTDA